MTMRHGPYQDVSLAIARCVPNEGISGHDVGHVEHADAVGTMRHMKQSRPRQTLPGGILAYGRRHSPIARPLGMGAGRRLDAIDGTHPGGKTDIMDAIWRRAF